jgi:type II secretory pathway pseudopilin PulG
MRLDRRALLAALVIVGLAALVFVARSGASSHPSDSASARAAQADRAQLLALAARGERATWLVTFSFARQLASGATLRQDLTEANRPPVHVNAGSDAVTVDFGDHVTSCTTTSKGPRCIDEKSSPSLAPSAVFRVVTRIGAYRVEREADTTIAGEPARCFRLVAIAATHTVPSLGTSSEQCYATDGVPLRSSVTTGTSTDTRTATHVTRDVTNARLDALLQQLDQKRAAAGQ